jgi:hypothetical protein
VTEPPPSDSSRPAQTGSGLAGAIGVVVVRPTLWGTAVRQVFVLARPGWWHRWPFLPLPDRDYLAFRLQTAYGRRDAPLQAADVVSYLHWCRAWPRVTGHSR